MTRTVDESELFASLAAGLPETAVDPTATGPLTAADVDGETTKVFFAPRDTFRAVVKSLAADGMSFLDILSMVKIIYDLITEYGPAVADIVRRIREKFGK